MLPPMVSAYYAPYAITLLCPHALPLYDPFATPLCYPPQLSPYFPPDAITLRPYAIPPRYPPILSPILTSYTIILCYHPAVPDDTPCTNPLQYYPTRPLPPTGTDDAYAPTRLLIGSQYRSKPSLSSKSTGTRCPIFVFEVKVLGFNLCDLSREP